MGPRNPFSNYPDKMMNSFQFLKRKRLSILSDVVALLMHLGLTKLEFIGRYFVFLLWYHYSQVEGINFVKLSESIQKIINILDISGFLGIECL